MFFITEYNPERDLCTVEQFGYVDLQKANATSTVDVEVSVLEERFNNIDDPRSIGDRPSDIFEEMQANTVIVNYKAPDSIDAAS